MSALLPRYGERSLADVMPAVLAALGVPSGPRAGAAIEVPECRAVAVLLVDGLGENLLRQYADSAPYLNSLPNLGPLTVGYPSSTSIGLTSLGTGVPPGTHGILGIAMRPDGETMLDTLTWCEHGRPERVDLREALVPETLQPVTTAWQQAAEHGIATYAVAPRMFDGSGLSRSALRGTDYRGTLAAGDLVAEVSAALRGPGRRLVYAYHADLDMLGHVHAPGSAPWRMQLRVVDTLAALIAESLPPGAQLLITGDHGMVAIDDKVDADTTPALGQAVTALGGDPRSRHVYTRAGAADDVAAAWCEVLGDRAWVLTRQDAIDAGWFGAVADDMRDRIGDVVAAMRSGAAVVRTVAEPMLSRLVGQHGSLTADEQLVPLLQAWPS